MSTPKYRVICQHNAGDIGYEIPASSLRAARKAAREHTESSYVGQAQAAVVRVLSTDRPPYREFYRCVNVGGNARSVEVRS